MARTKQQYNEFRKAFKKWCRKYRPMANHVQYGKAGVSLWNIGIERDDEIAEYIAPDYVNYMRYALRGVGK